MTDLKNLKLPPQFREEQVNEVLEEICQIMHAEAHYSDGEVAAAAELAAARLILEARAEVERLQADYWEACEKIDVLMRKLQDANVEITALHEAHDMWRERARELADHVNNWKARYQEAEADADQARNANAEHLQARHAAERQAQHWKANHDCQVAKAKLLAERPDLPVDRLPAYREMDRLQARVAELEQELGRLEGALDYEGI